MEFSGYQIKIRWDGQTLRVRGLSKMARMALLGKEHGDGDLWLQRDQIAEASYKAPGLFTNGRVTIRDAGGRRYVLHFRRKQRAHFERLASELA